MSDADSNGLSDRLKEISGDIQKREGRSRMTRGLLYGGIAAATLGLGAYVVSLLPDGEDRDGISVAETSDFPEDDAGFGFVAKPERPTATPAAAPTREPEAKPGPDEAAIEALRKRVEDLQAQLESARADASDEDLAAQQAELQRQVTALQKETAKAQQEAEAARRQYEMDLAAKDAELEHMRRMHEVELQQARLSAQPVGPDPDAEREAAERARLEELRAAQAAEREARAKSKMIAFGGGGEALEQADRALSAAESFVKRAVEEVPVSTASMIARPDLTVPQGTIIQAALETAIDSSLPGAIRAVVSEDVHSIDGSNVLIPRGSKIFGEYSSDVKVAQRRILIAWTRILTPEGRSVSIASYGTDNLGRSGTTGKVRTHFAQRFGGAALISIISAAPAIAAASASDAITSETLEGVGEDLGGATQSAIGDYLKIAPTIHIQQGARVAIVLDRDVELP